jgi:hypothetical protein
MKKSKYVTLAILVLLIITVAFFWSYGPPKSTITLISKGEKVGDSGFYFAGFTYIEAPHPTPPYGASPEPFIPRLLLSVVFKPISKYGTNGFLEPTEDDIALNLDGNTTTNLGFTIVSYNLARQAILIVYTGSIYF